MNKGPFNHILRNWTRINTEVLKAVTGQSQKTTQALLQKQFEDYTAAFTNSLRDPVGLVKQQLDWWQSQAELIQNALLKQSGLQVSPLIEPERGDHRFRAQPWQDHAWYDYLKQSYLLTFNHIMASIDSIPDLDEEKRTRLRYNVRQTLNAMSPSNYLATNPELLQITLESGGQNLARGMKLLSEDLIRSAGPLNVRMTDESAFELGKDLASSPGKVVYQNKLFELLQYQPSTETVAKRPLLFVPPYINKYYILDLRQKNSLVKYMVDQGHTVFMISWANPDKRHAKVDFEDYVVDGVLDAVDQVERLTGESEINGMGYCIGGTALTCAAAYQAATGVKQKLKSLSLFTTLLDYSQPGEMGVFINEPLVKAIEQENAQKGYKDGRQMAVTFSLMRENQLYWNYYIDGYLKGKTPAAFDLLYWNCDSTNVAGKTHSTMLRQFYLNNRLVQPGGFTVRGTPLDLSKIKIPSYFVSTREDHIALWQGTFRGMQALGGDKTFVLGESGHIAGIINPPGGKYGHYTGTDLDKDPQSWLANAERQEGSWWPEWDKWLASLNKAKPVEARQPAPGCTDAPGDYVKVRVAPVFAKEEA